MPSRYIKEDDYTLLVTNTLPSGGTLSRFFNFASEQVTTVYERKEALSDKQNAGYSSSPAVATAVSVALASQMSVQKFSEFDSPAEIELMREKLAKMGGTPPASNAKPKFSSTPKLTG